MSGLKRGSPQTCDRLWINHPYAANIVFTVRAMEYSSKAPVWYAHHTQRPSMVRVWTGGAPVLSH